MAAALGSAATGAPPFSQGQGGGQRHGVQLQEWGVAPSRDDSSSTAEIAELTRAAADIGDGKLRSVAISSGPAEYQTRTGAVVRRWAEGGTTCE